MLDTRHHRACCSSAWKRLVRVSKNRSSRFFTSGFLGWILKFGFFNKFLGLDSWVWGFKVYVLKFRFVRLGICKRSSKFRFLTLGSKAVFKVWVLSEFEHIKGSLLHMNRLLSSFFAMTACHFRRLNQAYPRPTSGALQTYCRCYRICSIDAHQVHSRTRSPGAL